jgi:RimJ/RimL family protein N-acetyltransferase
MGPHLVQGDGAGRTLAHVPGPTCAGRAYDDRIAGTLDYPDPQLRGSTFVLRPFVESDFDAAVEFGRDPATARWVPPLPADDPAGIVGLYDRFRVDGELLHLVIADQASDTYLGEVMVVMREDHVGEFGCGVAPHARGRGIAAEAFRTFVNWSATTLEVGRLQVLVAQENEPALRLAERTGFRREGVLRSYWEHDGARLDAVMLSMLPEEIF